MNKYFPERLLDLYMYIQKNTNTDIESLATAFNKSTRSIRLYIDEINSLIDEEESKIHLDKHLKRYKIIRPCFPMDTGNSIPAPETQEERIVFLAYYLVCASDYQIIGEIAEKIHVSSQTVTNDLKLIKELISKYSMSIEQKPYYGILLVGTESQKRSFLVDILVRKYNFRTEHFSCCYLFRDIDLSLIQQIVKYELEYFKLDVQDFQLDSLIMHIGIMVLRIMGNNYLSEHPREKVPLHPITIRIVDKINEQFNIVVPDFEMYQLNLLILNKFSFFTFTNEAELETIIDHFASNLKAQTGYQFKEDNIFIKDIKTHFSFFLERIKYQQYYRNPLLSEIKKKYQLEYNITLKALNATLPDFVIAEDEIGFITLHVRAFMERNSRLIGEKKLSAVLVCGLGIGTSRLIEARLNASIDLPFEITDVISQNNYQKREEIPCDFIISTIPVEEKNAPVIIVDPLLENKDITKIKNFCEQYYFNNQLLSQLLTEKNFIYSTKKYKNYVGIILDISKELRREHMVNDEFEQNVLNRELLSNTVVGSRVAIPHSLKGGILKPFIHVMILEQPVNWNSLNKVQIIFTLGLTEKQIEESRIFHEKLYHLLSNQGKLNKTIHSKNFGMFMSTFLS